MLKNCGLCCLELSASGILFMSVLYCLVFHVNTHAVLEFLSYIVPQCYDPNALITEHPFCCDFTGSQAYSTLSLWEKGRTQTTKIKKSPKLHLATQPASFQLLSSDAPPQQISGIPSTLVLL